MLLVTAALASAASAGIRSRIEQALAGDGEISEWRGIALTPGLVRFTCEQTGEKSPENVLKTIRLFRSKSPAYWPRPIGISWRSGAHKAVWEAADVEHQVWFRLEKPLADGETRTFVLPDGRSASLTYRATEPTPIIKFNQLGYVPSAAEKYAYVGDWAGTAGEVTPEVGEFRLVDEKTGQVVFSGTARRRPEDSATPDGKGVPWTGEIPWELDFSDFCTPGRYWIEVPGVGRSDTFPLGNESVEKAFAIHLAGMRRQRCGTCCHQSAYRGEFPADDHYGLSAAPRAFGFFDEDGKPAPDVSHFAVIDATADQCRRHEKVRVEGGWHDAADYDRRPYHLQAVGDFAALALLRPSCTNALEEAYWGLRHLLAAQEPSGGVGTWIETVRHPGVGEGPTSEQRRNVYFIARPTRNATLEFAAYAAMTALAVRERLRRCDDAAWQTRFVALTNAADRAWRFATEKDSGKSWVVNFGKRRLVYRQNGELRADMLVKASFDLSVLSDDDSYMAPVLAELPRVQLALRQGGGWKESPLLFIELDHYERRLDGCLRAAYKSYVTKVTSEADAIIEQLESAWPYRQPWHPPTSGHATKLGWGFNLPLTRARILMAAHAMTWQE